MTALIYGTAWKKEKTAACVERALSAGFRAIDTACQPKHYNEPGVGEGIDAFLSRSKIAREQLYIQTKFTSLSGQDPNRVPYDTDAPLDAQVRQSFGASLKNLKTTYLDALVLHSPLGDTRSMETVWRTMESLIDEGGVKRIGISNCYGASYFKELHRWARIKPAVLQNRFYAESGYDIELRAFCKEQDVEYQSFWTLTANPQLLSSRSILSLASQYGRTPAQILFRYLTQEGVTPLTGTQSDAHMREDLSIFDFELTDAERKSVTDLIEQ